MPSLSESNMITLMNPKQLSSNSETIVQIYDGNSNQLPDFFPPGLPESGCYALKLLSEIGEEEIKKTIGKFCYKYS